MPASGSGNRAGFWISRLRNSLIALLMPGMGLAAGLEEAELLAGTEVSVPLGAGQAASVTLTGETIRISAGDLQEDLEAVFLRVPPPLLIADINGDGLRDIFVPTDEGYGGVNVFYTLFLSSGSDGWSRINDISNPELSGSGALLSSHRSGPYWTETRWETTPDDLLYRRVTQTMIRFNILHRQLFRPDGTLERQMLIDPEASITHGASQLSIISEKPLDVWPDRTSDMPTGLTERGFRLRLLALDEASERVLVRLSDGTEGWIAASDTGLWE